MPTTTPRARLLHPRHAVWLLGAIVTAWIVPVGPWDGWQPERSGMRPQFLADDTTIVTAGPDNGHAPITGPIRLWDINTGGLLKSHFSTNDEFMWVWYERSINKVCLDQIEPSPSINASGRGHTLRLIDPWTGAEFRRFQTNTERSPGDWLIDETGRTLACSYWDSWNRRSIIWHDMATGRKLVELPNHTGSMSFSPDGRRFAAYGSNYQIHVFDVPSGEEIAHLDPNYSVVATVAFSPDGNLLVDGRGQVWDLANSQVKWSVPNLHYWCYFFVEDGTTLVAMQKLDDGFRLVFYEVASGRELVGRGQMINVGSACNLAPANPTKSLLSVLGRTETPPSIVHEWLGKLPYLRPIYQTRVHDRFVVIETSTGRQLSCGEGLAGDSTADGRCHLCYQTTQHWDGSSDTSWTIWNIPARRPTRWVLYGIFAWTVVWWLFLKLGTGLMRRLRRSSAVAQT